jgi:hypothetical protein
MVKAARDADRVVQVGLHRRVSPHPITGMAFLKSGKKIQRIPTGVSGQDGLGNRKQLVLGPSSKAKG